MQHVVEILAKIGGRHGVERGCEINEAHSASLRHRAHGRVPFGDIRQHVALRLHRIGKIAGKGEDRVAAARAEIARQIAIDDGPVERCRHCHQHRAGYALQETEEIAAKPPINRLRVRIGRYRWHVRLTGRRAEYLCETAQRTLAAARWLRERRWKMPGMPAEHHNVQRDIMSPVERLSAAQNVVVGIGLNAAIQELMARGNLVDQARPTPADAEHYRVTPNDRQLARRIARCALEPQLVDLEDDCTPTIDQHHVRSQCPRRLVEAEAFYGARWRQQVDALGWEPVRLCHGADVSLLITLSRMLMP